MTGNLPSLPSDSATRRRSVWPKAVLLSVRSGLIRSYDAFTGRRHLVLVFHRIRPSGVPRPAFDSCPSHSIERFRDVLVWLCASFHVVPLRRLVSLPPKAPPAAAITFDDGWRDTYDVAWPVLRELGIPATVFVTVGKIGRSEPFWQQELGHFFERALQDSSGVAKRRLLAALGMRQDLAVTEELFEVTVARWKLLDERWREGRMLQAGWDPDAGGEAPRCFLNESEIRALARAGIEIGSHGLTHTILSHEEPATVERELTVSRAALESIIGERVNSIAYPDGGQNASVVACARRAGVEIGCVTRARRMSHRDDPQRLPRMEPCWSLEGGESGGNLPWPVGSEVRRATRKPRSAAKMRGMDDHPLNILMLVDHLESIEAGTEQHLLFLLQGLPARGLRVHFAVFTEISGVDLSTLPVSPVILGEDRRSGVLGRMQRLRRLAQLIRSVRADVVHAFCPASEIAALLATRLARRAKVLGVRRNTGYWHTPWTLWRARLARYMGASYLANCEAARDFAIRREWIPRERIGIIRNAVSSRRLEQGLARTWTRSEIRAENGEAIVGIVATVRPVKDYETFLQAARLVLDRHPRTRFVSAGSHQPEYFSQVQDLASRLGVRESVTWLGPIENPFSLLPLLDVGVLSSVSEGLPNALIEYGAVGIPAVASAVGGNAEIVEDGKTGYLVPARSPEALADRVCRLLDDPALRKMLGDNARNRVEAMFSEQSVLREYVRTYRRLTGRSPISDGPSYG